MNEVKIKRLGFTLATTLILSACAGQNGEKFETPHNSYELSTITQLDQRQRANLFEAIITADLAEHQQDYQTATSHYLFAADLSKDIQLIEKSIQASQKASDPLGMEQAAKMWLEIDPASNTAGAYLLSAQIAQQDTRGAFATAKTLLLRMESSEEKYRFIESTILSQDPRMSFALVREMDNQIPREPAIKTGLAKLIMSLASANKRQETMLEQALTRANEALAIQPDFVPAVRVKSHALFQLRRDDLARNFLSDKTNEYPASVDIAQMLGQLLYDLHDYQASIAHYTDWLAENPKDLESRFYLAASYYSLDDNQESLKHFKILLDNDYQIETVAFFCGDAATKSEQFDLAIACFQRVDTGKFLVPSRLQLSRLYARDKDYQKSLNTLQIVSEETVSADREKLLIAEIDLLAAHFSQQKAKDRLNAALSQTPESPALLLKKIQIDELKSKPDELVSLLEQTRTLILPGEKLDNFILAAAALINNSGYVSRAVKWLDKALIEKPDDKDLLYTRAIYREPLGQYSKMVTEFKHLLSLYPEDLNIQNALGYTLADQNQELEYAKTLIEQAYQGLPDNAAVVDSKGWLAYRLGDYPSAIMLLTAAFKMSPSAEVAAHLGEVLWQDNKKEMAKKVWQQGLTLDNKNILLGKTLERFNVEL